MPLLPGYHGVYAGNLHLNALVKYLASAYALGEGEPQEQAAFGMSPFGASGEFFFHSLQDYIATMLVKSNDFLNVSVQIIGFHVSISNTLVKVGGVQVCALFNLSL